MNVELHDEITVRDLVDGYEDNEEHGVFGFGGKLDIRPPYQREFIYKDKQREAVIRSIVQGFPLNVMYWSVRDDGTYEIIDGQQRTISICQYIEGVFSVDDMFFHNLQDDEKEQILNYSLMIYFCEGDNSERLEWFKIINIAGEKLSSQELRNAVYAGPWVTDAKRYFSKMNGPAHNIAKDYIKGEVVRQVYLETAIKWISDNNIDQYMANHQHDVNANALWMYFNSAISWIDATFEKKRSIMSGIDWGSLYNEFKDVTYDTKELEEEISSLILDDDVTSKKGIYPYVLTRNEKHLSLRKFSDAMKIAAYEKQDGICSICHEKFELNEMEADHIIPWVEGGRTAKENCQMLCKACNRRKSST